MMGGYMDYNVLHYGLMRHYTVLWHPIWPLEALVLTRKELWQR